VFTGVSETPQFQTVLAAAEERLHEQLQLKTLENNRHAQSAAMMDIASTMEALEVTSEREKEEMKEAKLAYLEKKKKESSN
jgi:hypothetical protein